MTKFHLSNLIINFTFNANLAKFIDSVKSMVNFR